MQINLRHLCSVAVKELASFVIEESKRGRVPDEIAVMRTMTGEDQDISPADAEETRAPEPQSQDYFSGNSSVTPQETLEYQVNEMVKQFNQIETHLSQGCQIMGKTCDCCLKHGLLLLGLAEETIPIAGRAGASSSPYVQTAEWVKLNLAAFKDPREASDQLPQLAAQAGTLRKRLTA